MAALVGRILRSLTLFAALFALVSTAQAAPYAAIVMDARTGETLWQKNADARLHPASLTKMMTLYIAFQEIEAGRLSLDSMVTVSKHAAAQPPSRLGLKPGQKIALRYLIRAAAIKSANDAATAIGEHIGKGSEAAFAKRMTKTARALGMKNSTFRNPNGLTADGHLSSARDMTVLGRHLFYDFPQYYGLFSRRTADAGMAEVRNTNTRFLDAYEGADGIKTGYTVAAGFNLTASAKRGDVRIIATVFGGASTAARNAKMVELMDLGFSLAKKRSRTVEPDPAPLPAEEALVAEAAPIDEPDVEGGSAKTIRISGEVVRSLRPKARPAAAAPAPEVPDALAAAIAEGVDSALAEATAPPPPEGTLEAQALAMVETAPELIPELAPDLAPELAPELIPGQTGDTAAPAATEDTTEPEDGAVAALAAAEGAPELTPELTPELAAAAPAEGSLEAQAAALAAGAAPAEAPRPAVAADPALAAIRPQPRPERPASAETPVAETPVAVAAAPETVPEAVPETVAATETVAALPDPSADPAEAPPVNLAEAAPAAEAPLPAVSAVETVSAPAEAVAEGIADPVAPARAAPIFDTVTVAEAAPEEAEALVVVSKSTSGGEHWSVNVGAFTSRSEAERALTKTGIAESATLDQGSRKVTERGGKYRASFLGLTADQADLACRRIRARGQACETQGPA